MTHDYKPEFAHICHRALLLPAKKHRKRMQEEQQNINIVQQYLSKYDEEWEHTRKQAHGDIIFSTITGSRLYQTYDLHTSDVDIVSIYLCPIEYLIGLDEYKSKHCVATLTNNKAVPRTEQQQQQEQPSIKLDYLAYEIGRFCNMMIQGNPIALEILSIVVSRRELSKIHVDIWQPLIDQIVHTNALITQELVLAYESYANGQYKQAFNLMDTAGFYDERAAKSMYHAIRVILEAIHVASNLSGPRLTHSEEYLQLMVQIKKREITFEETEQRFKDLVLRLAPFKQSEQFRNLPKTVSNETKHKIHEWMVSVRKQQAKFLL